MLVFDSLSEISCFCQTVKWSNYCILPFVDGLIYMYYTVYYIYIIYYVLILCLVSPTVLNRLMIVIYWYNVI